LLAESNKNKATMAIHKTGARAVNPQRFQNFAMPLAQSMHGFMKSKMTRRNTD
jgi:hypothetical protein